MVDLLHPTSDLVAMAWLQSIPQVLPNQVGTTLPAPPWPNNAFIVVCKAIGGSPDPYIQIAQPVLEIEYYAVRPQSNKPHWGKANQLFEIVRHATYDRVNMGRALNIIAQGQEYNGANCLWVSALTEPRKTFNDTGSYACFSSDVQFKWREVNVVYP